MFEAEVEVAVGRVRMGRGLPEGEVYREGSVQEFCGLTDDEMAEIDAGLDAGKRTDDLKLVLSRSVTAERTRRSVTQAELASRIGSSQSRVAALERGGASLDLVVRALFALGVSNDELATAIAVAGGESVNAPSPVEQREQIIELVAALKASLARLTPERQRPRKQRG